MTLSPTALKTSQNRDRLTATGQRKNDGATEQKLHNATEDRNRGKRSLFKRQWCKALADKEQHEWELPNEFASYANKCLQKFVQDKNLSDRILNEKPVHTNFTKLRKLNKYYK